MALIPHSELVQLVKDHPEYCHRSSGEVPADVAFGILFGSATESAIRTETFEIRTGETLVVDFDASGKVIALEIN